MMHRHEAGYMEVKTNNARLEESFDLDKFLFVLRRSILWIIMFLILGVSVAYLVVRYTKPLYESSAVVKLNFKSEAKTLGLVATDQFESSLEDISGEIELIQSKLFLSRVCEALRYNVSYFVYGTYLVDERYENAPFIVSYKIHNTAFYDRKIDLEIKDENSFELAFSQNGSRVIKEYQFGQEITNDDFNLLIEKSDNFSRESIAKYYFTINSEEALIRSLEENLTVVPENIRAKTIKISFTDYNRFKARDFVKTISELYLEYTTETKSQTIIQKINFLDEQISDAEDKLQEFDEYFENFTIENKTVSLEADLSNTIEVLNVLDTQRYALQEKIQAVGTLVSRLESDSPENLNPLLLNKLPNYIVEATEDYQILIEERNKRLNSYNEASSIIARIDDQLKLAKENVMEVLDQYDQQLSEQLGDISNRRNQLEQNFAQLPSMGTQYNKTKRLYQQREEFLSELRQAKMELEITKAGTVTEFVILSPASLPGVPIKPQKLMIYGVGLVFAIVISVIFILLRYLLHNKITSVKELERLTDIPILGAIPSYNDTRLEHTKLVVNEGSRKPLSEALRSIRTNMEFINKNGAKVICTTSTVSGEGKTFVATNYGAILAMSGKKVCIVDVDMRKPKVLKALDIKESEHGVSTYLIGKSKVSDCVHKTDVEGLSVLGTGPTPPNPSELILSEKFDQLLEELKKEFDSVILDTPPVGLVTDGILVMRKSDVQLYIVRSDFSKRAFIQTLKNVQSINDFKNLALILNGLGPRSGYGYGYGYGYGVYSRESRKYFETTPNKKIASILRSLF